MNTRSKSSMSTIDRRGALLAAAALALPLLTSAALPKAMAEPLYAAAYKNAPHATLIEMPDSAHFIMLDQPERFAAQVDAFLKCPCIAEEVCFSFFSSKPSCTEAYPSFSKVFTCVITQGPASMMVQAVCFPSGVKMLVIPIFFPIIPFIYLRFLPRRL